MDTDTPDTDTLPHRILHWANKTPEAPATHLLREGQWHTTSWAEHWRAITEVGRGLLTLGHEAGQCVAIGGRNCPAWVESQFGTAAIGGIPAAIYPTSTEQQIGHILRNCGARIVVCDGPELLDKVLSTEASGACQPLAHFVVFDDIEHSDPRVLGFRALRERGRQQTRAAFDARLQSLRPDDTCLLIYTSGTTGHPKGVMLSHRGQLSCITGVMAMFPMFDPQSAADERGGPQTPYRVVSYLPLSHQTEQLVTNVGSIITGGQVFFCPDLALVRDYLTHARPTLFMAVPRVWEKFEAALSARLSEQQGLAGALARLARSVELRGFDRDVVDGQYHGGPLRALARKLVIDRVKAGLGLDQLVAGFTGSAPVAVDTMRFFGSLGITIHEAYGLTETSGVCTANPYGKPRLGTVGKPLQGATLKIAEDGEVWVKGPINTRGYYNQPEATALLFDAEGYLATGDLGQLDEAGYLRITGRKKELLVTAGGKNVAPVELEEHVKAIVGVGLPVVVGDRQPYLTALLSLDPENLEPLARAAGVPNDGGGARDMAKLAADPRVHAHLMSEVERLCNRRVARYQTIKKIHVLSEELSIEAGELTPTMKLRREAIAARHADTIAAMYADKNHQAAQ